jgi:hypothetical protein
MALHRINRTEVELRCGDVALARALSDRVGRMHRTRIVPVLDRVCSELSASAALVRIDRLDLDLGALAVDDLEDAFIARLESALRAALGEVLRRRASGDRSARDSLELIETFALTGGLPWWAPLDRDVVAHHLARASAETGAELVALVGRIACDPGALDRIARLCGPKTLATLVERALADPRRSAGQPSANPRVEDDSARRTQRAEPVALDEEHAGAWNIGHRDVAQPSGRVPVHDATAASIFAASPVTDDELRPLQQAGPAALDEEQAGTWDVRHRDAAPPSDRPPVHDAAGTRSSAASQVVYDERADLRQAGPTALDEEQARAQDIGHRDVAPPSGRPPVHATAVVRSSAASQVMYDERADSRPAGPTALDEAQAGVRDIGDRDVASPSGRPPVHDATVAGRSAASRVTDDAPRRWQRSDSPPHEQPRSPAQPRRDGVPVSPRMARGPWTLPTDSAAARAIRRRALARLDELYVDDAGLVILWPFLERFFLSAGVLGEDRGFLDEIAQLQAVALVHSLATADPAPLEFHLPLTKLLCGRSLESDFALERPLAPEQLAEGDRLLAAVIDRVPALGEPSIAELRAGFLARPGALGARDGAWLLQVERRPHDNVLDRFPWSWSWVRLPWMPVPLRVEW